MQALNIPKTHCCHQFGSERIQKQPGLLNNDNGMPKQYHRGKWAKMCVNALVCFSAFHLMVNSSVCYFSRQSTAHFASTERAGVMLALMENVFWEMAELVLPFIKLMIDAAHVSTLRL